MRFLRFAKEAIKQNIKYVVTLIIIAVIIIPILTSGDFGTTITVISTALSVVFIGVQACNERISNTVFRQREAIKVIGVFDDLVLSRMRDINNSHNFGDITKKS